MKLSFSTLACPTWGYEKVIREAVAYGYEGVEWRLLDENVIDSNVPLAVARRVGDATRSAGLEVSAVDSGIRLTAAKGDASSAVLSEARAMLEVAGAMGAEHLRVFLDDIPAGVSFDRAAEWTRENLNALSDAVTASGVRLAIELHNPFGPTVAGAPKVTSSQFAMKSLEGVNNEAVGIQWDWGNPYLEDEEAAETWERIRSNLFYCHTKDLGVGEDDQLVYVPMGTGIIPVSDILTWLSGANFNGWLSYEWEKKWHPELAEPEVALPQYIEAMRRLLP
jgi:sugar phosphate isomerase/epimerase